MQGKVKVRSRRVALTHDPDQAAHPPRTAPEAAQAAAAFPPLEVAWIPVRMEWSVAEDMMLTLRA